MWRIKKKSCFKKHSLKQWKTCHYFLSFSLYLQQGGRSNFQRTKSFSFFANLPKPFPRDLSTHTRALRINIRPGRYFSRYPFKCLFFTHERFGTTLSRLGRLSICLAGPVPRYFHQMVTKGPRQAEKQDAAAAPTQNIRGVGNSEE